MSFARELAVRAGWLEHRREPRVPAQELSACYRTGSKQNRARVKDISCKGVYLFSIDRWPIGTSVILTLIRRTALTTTSLPSVRLSARSVRMGADGAAFRFESEHVCADTWASLVLKAADLATQWDAIRVFRLASALAFLRRTSPAAESSVLQHIAGELIYEGGDRAVDVILKAEELMMTWNFAVRTGVSPGLILSILERASRISTDWVRQYWAGMLASSVQYWAKDRDSVQFATLLAKLDPAQFRILDVVCSRALRAEREAASRSPREFPCSREIIQNTVRIRDPFDLERHLDRLYDLGLLERTFKYVSSEPIMRANLTPTRIGLRLYARTRGLLEPPEAGQLPERVAMHYQGAADAAHAGQVRESPSDRLYSRSARSSSVRYGEDAIPIAR